MQKKIYLPNEDDTLAFGEKLGERLQTPVLIYLEGDLGAGKTYLSKGIAKGLDIEEEITSPTFTLINEYPKDEIHLYHLDLYRLNSVNEVLNLGIEDFINEPGSVVLIEWAEKLGDYDFAANLIKIKIKHLSLGRDVMLETDLNYLEDFFVSTGT